MRNKVVIAIIIVTVVLFLVLTFPQIGHDYPAGFIGPVRPNDMVGGKIPPAYYK